MKKFELTEQKIDWYGKILYRIKSCANFVTISGKKIHIGDLGGFVEEKSNLSDYGNAWIREEAKVYDNATVSGNAEIYGEAEVYGVATVSGNAKVYDQAKVWCNATIGGFAKIYGKSEIWGSAIISGHAKVYGEGEVYYNAIVSGDSKVYRKGEIRGNVIINDGAFTSLAERIICTVPVNKSGEMATMFRSKKNEINVSFAQKTYVLEDFKDLISGWDDEEKEIAVSAIELVQKYIDLSEENDYSSPLCPRAHL